jgi:hypothetical protein
MIYDVNVSRISTAPKTIRVEADSREEAEEMAVELAHDEDFTGCVTDYQFEVNGAAAVQDRHVSPYQSEEIDQAN